MNHDRWLALPAGVEGKDDVVAIHDEVGMRFGPRVPDKHRFLHRPPPTVAEAACEESIGGLPEHWPKRGRYRLMRWPTRHA
jgi:hypothetical protein